MDASTRFSSWFVAWVLCLVALVAAFDIAVDPYLVFDRPRVVGFNALKPAVNTRERLMKAYDAPRHLANTVILGSSRSDIGFDPKSDAWPADARPVYNLSLAGSDTQTGLRYLQNMIALRASTQQPRTILVGLDFEYFLSSGDFKARRSLPSTEAEERLLHVEDGRPNPARRWRIVKDHLTATLSLDALSDSIGTIVASRRANGPNVEPDGHMSESAFRTLVSNDGVATLFAQKNREFAAQYGKPRQVLSPNAVPYQLDGVLAFAKNQGVRMIFFAQPAHADRLEMLDKLGYWKAFEQWKRDITQRVAMARAEGVSVSFWDFAGYEPPSLEVVPPTRDLRARLAWFWEPAHYMTALGDVMILRMLGQGDVGDYGVVLAPDNIEERLAEVRAARSAYRAGASAASERLDVIVCGRPSCLGPTKGKDR